MGMVNKSKIKIRIFSSPELQGVIYDLPCLPLRVCIFLCGNIQLIIPEILYE